MISHGVSDIVWHSLGMDQGFIRALAAQDFDGHFENAHSLADPTSDFAVSRYGAMQNYLVFPWKVPTADVVAIYHLMNYTNVTQPLLGRCVLEGMIITQANKNFGKYLYPIEAQHAPFMTTDFWTYFKGGMFSMAVDVQQCWQVLM